MISCVAPTDVCANIGPMDVLVVIQSLGVIAQKKPRPTAPTGDAASYS